MKQFDRARVMLSGV